MDDNTDYVEYTLKSTHMMDKEINAWIKVTVSKEEAYELLESLQSFVYHSKDHETKFILHGKLETIGG